MSTHGEKMTMSLLAGANLSSYQYYLVELSASTNKVSRATSGSNTWPVGVLWDDPDAAGEGALVAFAGEVKARACADSTTFGGLTAGSGISFKNRLAWDALGQLIKAPASGSAHCFAVALEALPSGSGNIRVLIQPGMFNTNT